MESIGTDLFALVHHLYRTKPSAEKALSELTLRCHEKYEVSDVQMAPTAREITYTRWFAAMKARFKALRDQITTQPGAKEAEELALGLYPSGCTVSQLLDAFRAVADMLSFRISDATVVEVASQRQATLEGRNVARITGKDFAKEVVSYLVVPSQIPARWWEKQTDAKKSKLTTVLAVGLRCDPPSIIVEYQRGDAGKKRHRTVYLHEVLSTGGSTLPLAKRLAATHGALLNETEIQRYLLKLQKLMKEPQLRGSAEAADEPPKRHTQPPAAAAAVSDSGAAAAKTKAGAGRAANEPVKADLGLLYRDPEAALRNVDLQDADEFTLKEYKAKMNETFSEHAVKPGDPRFVYDRRAEFKATKKSEWDDDDGESGDDF